MFPNLGSKPPPKSAASRPGTRSHDLHLHPTFTTGSRQIRVSKLANNGKRMRPRTIGYHFYVPGHIPEPKNLALTDAKIIAQYDINISKQTRARHKKAGLANVQYLRISHFKATVLSDESLRSAAPRIVAAGPRCGFRAPCETTRDPRQRSGCWQLRRGIEG